MKKLLVILIILLAFIPSILIKPAEVVSAKTVADLKEELRKIEEREKNNKSKI